MNSDVRSGLFGHIAEYAAKSSIFIDRINGVTDHVHLLLSLGSGQSISKIIQQIKGKSAYWINRSGILPFIFSWQEEYFAVSVSESQLDKVRNYIENQIEHHKTISFADEYQEFIEKFGFRES